MDKTIRSNAEVVRLLLKKEKNNKTRSNYMPSTGDIFQIQRYKKVESILYFHSLLPSSNTFFIQSLWLEITYQLSITLRNNKINPNFLCHVQSPTSLDHQVGLQIRSISITWGLLRNAHLGPHPRRKKKEKVQQSTGLKLKLRLSVLGPGHQYNVGKVSLPGPHSPGLFQERTGGVHLQGSFQL